MSFAHQQSTRKVVFAGAFGRRHRRQTSLDEDERTNVESRGIRKVHSQLLSVSRDFRSNNETLWKEKERVAFAVEVPLKIIRKTHSENDGK